MRIISILFLAFCLASCSQEDSGSAAPANADASGAEGQILQGSISDAMIPLDQVTSTSPPAVIVAEGAVAGEVTESGTATAGEDGGSVADSDPGTAPAPESDTVEIISSDPDQGQPSLDEGE